VIIGCRDWTKTESHHLFEWFNALPEAGMLPCRERRILVRAPEVSDRADPPLCLPLATIHANVKKTAAVGQHSLIDQNAKFGAQFAE
jgi:hypothetical protein